MHAEDDGLLAKLNSKVSTKARIASTRQLATLVGRGCRFRIVLHMIAEETDDKPTKAMVEEIAAQVEAGRTLHDAFAKHPRSIQ